MDDDVKKNEVRNVQQDSPTKVVFSEGAELASKIANEQDIDKINDLTNLFKINQKKKDILRLNKLNGIQEMIDDEVFNRVSVYADAIDNKELVSYMNSTSNAINNIKMSMEAPAPAIQINNQTNEVHVNSSGFNRESREKIVNAVQAILSNLNVKEEPIDVEVKKKEDR